MNNPILENIRTRRSLRKYKEAQITEDELNTVLEAGTYAPSGRGLQSPIDPGAPGSAGNFIPAG